MEHCRLSSPRMRLLDRYLIKELAPPFGFCLCGFFILWTGTDLFNQLAQFQNQNLGLPGILTYYSLKAPEFLGTVAPVALLFGLLFALSRHARHNEIVAARAAGISIWRLATPYYMVGIMSGGLIYLANNVWLPEGSQKANDMLGGKSIPEEQQIIENWDFVNPAADRVWNAKTYNRVTGAMTDVMIQWKEGDSHWLQLKAETATYEAGTWRFEKVFFRETFDLKVIPAPIPKETMEFTDFPEEPKIIESERRVKTMDVQKMSKKIRFTLAEIREYLRLHPDDTGVDAYKMKTQLHAHLSTPWTCLVVVVIAVPFGTLNARKNLFAGFAWTVAICFTYFVLNRLGLVLGTSGKVLPWVGAWLANIVFVAGGLFTTWKLR